MIHNFTSSLTTHDDDDDDDDDDQLQVWELGDKVSADPGGVEEPFAVRLVHNLPL